MFTPADQLNNTARVSGQKILVTGGSGFIGSHLCRSLYENGAEVYSVTRANLLKRDDGVRWQQGDLSDYGFVHDLLRAVKPSIIFHLASHVFGSRDLTMVMPTFRNNLMTTVNLLTAATELGCHRFIAIGSMEEPQADSMNIIPSSPYAAAKWTCTAYANMFYALYRTPVVIARLFMVYGPGQNDLKKLVPYVTLSYLRNQAPRLSSGTRQVDWIYVQDVVEGLVAIACAPDIEGDSLDLGSGSLTSIHTVVEYIRNLVNPEIEPLFGALNDRPMEQMRVANISDTFEKIAWKPVVSLQKGLSHTVEWYRSSYINAEKNISG